MRGVTRLATQRRPARLAAAGCQPTPRPPRRLAPRLPTRQPLRFVQAVALKAGRLGWERSVVEPLTALPPRRARRRGAAARRASSSGSTSSPTPAPTTRTASSGPRPSAASTPSSPRPGSPTCWRSPRTSRATTSTPRPTSAAPLDPGEIETLQTLATDRRRLRPARRRSPHPPRQPAPALRALRPLQRRGRRADRRRPRDLRRPRPPHPRLRPALQPLRRRPVPAARRALRGRLRRPRERPPARLAADPRLAGRGRLPPLLLPLYGTSVEAAAGDRGPGRAGSRPLGADHPALGLGAGGRLRLPASPLRAAPGHRRRLDRLPRRGRGDAAKSLRPGSTRSASTTRSRRSSPRCGYSGRVSWVRAASSQRGSSILARPVGGEFVDRGIEDAGLDFVVLGEQFAHRVAQLGRSRASPASRSRS